MFCLKLRVNFYIDWFNLSIDGTPAIINQEVDTVKFIRILSVAVHEDDPLTINGASTSRQVIQVQPARLFPQYTVQGMETMFWPHPVKEKIFPEKDAILNADPWGNGYANLDGPRRTSARGLMTSWLAKGESVLVGVFYANAPGEEPINRFTINRKQHEKDWHSEGPSRTGYQQLENRDRF